MDWTPILWYVLVGLLLVTTATFDVVFRRLPISTAMIYLGLGVAVGPIGLQLIVVDPMADAKLLEHLAEIAVITSLFAAGLKMRLPLRDRRWIPPLLLASVGMLLTVAAVAAVGFWGVGLSIGGAVLLGAVLAPTDPVLASEVQLTNADDRDRLRLTITGEAGLNDGTAFPFVLLAIGLFSTQLHDLGAGWWRWITIDLLWAVAGGLGVGFFAGLGIGRLVLSLRRRFHESLTADEMLTIGMIALVYGLALSLHTYGFLAVFAAAVAIRWEEYRRNPTQSADPASRESGEKSAAAGGSGEQERANANDLHDPSEPSRTEEGARDEHAAREQEKQIAPARLAHAQLRMTESAERLIEVTLVVLVGSLISHRTFTHASVWWFVPLLVLVIRPAIVFASTAGVRMIPAQRALAGWFGIRGIGTLYYLAYAFDAGVAGRDPAEADLLVDLALATITVSVVVHGISATPLMNWYAERRRRRHGHAQPPTGHTAAPGP